MSRMATVAVAILVCWGFASWSGAEEPPAAEKEAAPAQQGSLSDVFKPQTLYGVSEIAPTTENSATAVAADEIEQALKKPVDLRFTDTPLSDVVDYCSEHLDINIRLDPKGLTDAAVDPSAPVTFSTHKPVTFESALRIILDEFDLAFVDRNETLCITSKEKADEVFTTEVHYVGDLVVARGSKRQNFGPLRNLITSTVQPNTWDDNGGSGSIQPFPATESLVFSQKQDVHAEVAELLAKLRRELREHGATASARDEGLRLRSYPLGSASGDQTAEAIKKLIAPPTWQRNGGEGEICVISRRTPQPGQAEAIMSDVLVVRQIADVHDQIADLLGEMPTYGMGGGVGGGPSPGGGMFRVPDHR